MKASSATSARATAAPRPTGRSSGRHPHSRTSAEAFALSGPSKQLDPRFNAYRKDLADVSLAGRVIASHYAEPVGRRLKAAAMLCSKPAADCEALRELGPGETFLMLDEALGWAWGYASEDRQVGYVPSEALARQ